MYSRSLTLIEFLVITCLICVFVGMFATYANITLKTAREITLQNELLNIRRSIEHYQIINGSFPQDLVSLLNQGFTLRGPDGIIFTNKFLKPFRIDKQGYLIDPFMNRYSYDKKEARVKSQTKGYESW